MDEEAQQAERKAFRLRILTIITIIAALLSIGTIGYHNIEKHTYLDSLYFSVETLTTIGYGDLVPVTDAGKIFTILYAVFGVGLMLYLITTLAGHYMAATQQHVEQHLKRTIDMVSNIPEPKDIVHKIGSIQRSIRRRKAPRSKESK